MAFVYFENIAVSSILQLINHCCAIAFILARVHYFTELSPTINYSAILLSAAL